MNTITATPLGSVVRPAIEPRTAWRLARTEYARIADAVDALRPGDWARTTDCPDWDVRQLVAHVVGMTAFATTPLEVARQTRLVTKRRRNGQEFVDAQTALQVEEREGRTLEELRAELRRQGRRAVRGRRLLSALLRPARMPDQQLVNGSPEAWSFGFLLDVILTRDPWMHRLDLARATGSTPLLTPDHDGVIVADVVAEWTRRHGQPYELTLTGPAGGRWRQGQDGEVIEMDAADFCRVVSGRPASDGSHPSGLLSTNVPF